MLRQISARLSTTTPNTGTLWASCRKIFLFGLLAAGHRPLPARSGSTRGGNLDRDQRHQ